MHYLDGRYVFQGYGAPPVLGGQQQTIVLNPKTPAQCAALCAQHSLPYKGINAKGQCTCGKVQTLNPSSPAPSAPPPPLGPPPVLRQLDCVGLPMPAGSVTLPTDFMRRVQAALNYCHPGPIYAPVPITGQFDFLTTIAWSQFVQRYGTWDSTTQKYIGSDPGSITCDGLMLLKATNDQIYASQQDFIGPLDAGAPGGRVAATPSSTIGYEERDKLWVVSPDSRPTLRQALSNMTHTVTKTGSAGTIYARCDQSSTQIPLGQDALTQLRTKIAAGYAALIATKSDFSQVWIAYTQKPMVIAQFCSTKGSLAAARAGGSMNGFGINASPSMLPPGQSGTMQIDPSQMPPQPPDTLTGLPAWALYEGEPPTLIDQARALFTVTGATPSPATTPPGSITGAPPPSSYIPQPYPTPQGPAPAAPVTATSPSWVKPLAVVGALGLVAYFAFGE